jgi:hypothetical protein
LESIESGAENEICIYWNLSETVRKMKSMGSGEDKADIEEGKV